MKRNWTSEELESIEEVFALAFKEGRINCPIHLCGGNEAQLIALFASIKDMDYVFSTHRSHYHYLLKGGSLMKLQTEVFGCKGGMCGGKGRSMHITDTSIRFYSSAIIGGTPAIAVGVALGIKKRYKGRKIKPHVWCFVGDGAEDSGHFMEAVRFGLSRNLSLTFVVEDNDLAVESTKKQRWHNYFPVIAGNVMRYKYTRKYPHVGVGKNISF